MKEKEYIAFLKMLDKFIESCDMCDMQALHKAIELRDIINNEN